MWIGANPSHSCAARPVRMCISGFMQDYLSDLENYDLAGNVEVEGHAAPLTNMATMETMLKLALAAPLPDAEARAYPIVEVLE